MKQTLDSATFWMNKIRREAHDRMDKKPQDWCAALIAMMKELINLITEHYPNGFKWNDKGVAVSDYTSSVPAPAATPVATPAAPKADLQSEVSERRASEA